MLAADFQAVFHKYRVCSRSSPMKKVPSPTPPPPVLTLGVTQPRCCSSPWHGSHVAEGHPQQCPENSELPSFYQQAVTHPFASPPHLPSYQCLGADSLGHEFTYMNLLVMHAQPVPRIGVANENLPKDPSPKLEQLKWKGDFLNVSNNGQIHLQSLVNKKASSRW